MTAPTPPPADSRDARVERIEVGIADAGGDAGDGQWWLNLFESAGLLVLLPDDATRERIAFGIFGGSERSWAASLNHPSPNERDHAFDAADRVLAALAERPSGDAG